MIDVVIYLTTSLQLLVQTVRFCALENPELGTKSWVSVASPRDTRVFTLNRLPSDYKSESREPGPRSRSGSRD